MTQTPQAEDPADAPPSAAARGVLALVIAGTLLVVLDITIVTVGLPRIQAELGGSLASIQWVLIAYTLTMGAVTQTVGTLSDRLGRRPVYLTGIGLFTVASLACGLAPTTGALDAARGVQGIGGAILMANGLPLISQAYQGQRRNMAIATWSTAATAAGVVAPLAGGLLVDALNWRAMFLVNVPVGVFAFAVALAWLPRDARTGGSRAGIDWGGTVLLIASLGLANFALLRGAEVGWASGRTLAQFAAAAVLLAGFIVVQRRVPAPTLELSLFRASPLTGAALAVFMSRVLTIGGTVYFVQYLQGSLHLTPTQSGLVLVPAFVAQMAAGMLGGKLQARFAPGYIIATGYTGKAAAAAWMALVFTPSAEPWLLAIPLLIWGFGGGLAGAPVMSVAMRAASPQQTGMVAGTITSLASIGAGVGTAVLGVLYTARLRAVVAGDPAAVPDTARDAVAAAVAQGDLQQALALTPPDARAGVQDLLEQAIASGTSAVLWSASALALATVVVVLALIGRRDGRGSA